MIINFFKQYCIRIENLYLSINSEIILETNLEARLMTNSIPNIPFLPDLIIDVSSDKLVCRVLPSLINVINYFKLY